MKIVVIQPSSAGDISTENVTEFKLDINQFSVVDRFYFLKEASELICSYLISVSILKEKLQRYYKKMENKLKTETAEKKPLEVKKGKLEKRIVELSKESGSKEITSLLQENDTEIQALEKKLKIIMMQELKQLN